MGSFLVLVVVLRIFGDTLLWGLWDGGVIALKGRRRPSLFSEAGEQTSSAPYSGIFPNHAQLSLSPHVIPVLLN